jgi:hypothetical protein
MKCDQCDMVAIQGIPCHETGCPNAWKDQKRTCVECGIQFPPTRYYQTVCNDCLKTSVDESF